MLNQKVSTSRRLGDRLFTVNRQPAVRGLLSRQANSPILRRNIAAVITVASAIFSFGLPAQENAPRDGVWYPNGPIYVIDATPEGTYIGGAFSYIGPYTGASVVVDSATGQTVAGFPTVDGAVSACASDEEGSWYIGGSFSHVGGVSRDGLAHILPDGSVDPAWDPYAQTEQLQRGHIEAIVFSGRQIYVGGSFAYMNGYARNNLAALNRDGSISDWNPNVLGSVGAFPVVAALAVAGETIYIGGNFISVGGLPRGNLAAVNFDGAVTDWSPIATAGFRSFDSVVEAIVVSGGTVYVAGGFGSVGGLTRGGLAAIDSSGSVTSWNPNSTTGFGSSSFKALALTESRVYVGGSFEQVGPMYRSGLAAIDFNGAITSWNPEVSDETGFGVLTPFSIESLAVSGDTVYVGGQFTSIYGQPRSNIAAIHTDGALTDWNPGAGGPVSVLSVAMNDVYIGGDITSVGGVSRYNCACVDPDGKATSWDPIVWSVSNSPFNPYETSFVTSLAVADETVYIGGTFSHVNGQSRNNLAALSTDGTLDSWSPDIHSGDASFLGEEVVSDLAVVDGVVYFAGHFPYVNGVPRNNIAAVILDATGTLSEWNPNVTGGGSTYDAPSVYALEVSGDTLYIGGSFAAVGGQARSNLAAVDIHGSVTPWNPIASGGFGSTGGRIDAIAISNGIVYVGGQFQAVGGQNRYGLGAINANGIATAWNPAGAAGNLGIGLSFPSSLCVVRNTVFVGANLGTFSLLGPRGLGAVDVNGTILPWRPDFDSAPVSSGTVYAIAASDTAVYAAGGGFSPTFRSDGLLGVFDRSPIEIPPAPPSGPGVMNIRLDSLTWTWLDNSNNETGFKVFSDPGSGLPATLRTTTVANTTSWKYSGLLANSQYSFQVSASNAGGDSAKTQNHSAWTAIQPVTSLAFSGTTPYSINVSPSGTFNNLSTESSGVLIENVTAGEDSGWRKTTTAWTASSLQPNTAYTFRGHSRNAAGLPSSPVSVTKFTAANVPVAPIVSQETATSAHIAIDSTDGNPAGTFYALQVLPTINGKSWIQSNGSLGNAAVFNTTVFWSTVTMTGLLANSSYTVSAYARNGDGEITAAGPSAAFSTLNDFAPTVSLTTTAPEITNSNIHVTVTCSEVVFGLSLGDILGTNCTITNLSGAGANYTFTLVPRGQGTVSVSIPANVCVDTGGNANAASNVISRVFDSVFPTAILSSVSSNPTSNSSIPITLTLSEPVVILTAEDISVTNATVSSFAGSHSQYEFALLPVNSGVVSAYLRANSCMDAAGNTNLASNVLTRTYENAGDWQTEPVSWRVEYGANWERSGFIFKPGAEQIRVHFSVLDLEAGHDFLRTNDGDEWSGAYTDRTSTAHDGDSITLSLKSDDAPSGYFFIDRVEWKGMATGSATASGDLFFDFCTVKVTRPKGGQVFDLGSAQSIKWKSSDACSPDVRIELWRDGRKVRNIKRATPNDGKVVWYLDPTKLTPGTGYVVRIVSMDIYQPISAFSGTFSIASAAKRHSQS